MDLQEFKKSATRTESVQDQIEINHSLFAQLREVTIRIGDSLDLIKKNAFYGKPIDQDRIVGNFNVAMETLRKLKLACVANPAYLTKVTPSPINSREFHGIIGIITEAAEMLELVDLDKKETETVKVVDEMGDLFWYIAILADVKNVDIEEQVLEAVIAKLRKRFPDKFDAALAITRDKEAEQAVTQEVFEKTSAEETDTTGFSLDEVTVNSVVKKEVRKRRKKPTVAKGDEPKKKPTRKRKKKAD